MATIPAQITWTTGTVVTAAQLNTNVRDAVNFFVTPPSAGLTKTGTTSLTSSGATWTPITWDTEDWDNDGSHSTVTNTSRFTVNTAGKYMCSAQVEFSSNATGIRAVGFRVNATGAIYYQAELPAANGNVTVVSTSGIVPTALSDYIEVVALQNSGSTLTANSNSRASMLWVST